MGNAAKLVTLRTQDTRRRQTLEKTERTIKDWQFSETGNIAYTRHKTKTNVRENRKDNQGLAI